MPSEHEFNTIAPLRLRQVLTLVSFLIEWLRCHIGCKAVLFHFMLNDHHISGGKLPLFAAYRVCCHSL